LVFLFGSFFGWILETLISEIFYDKFRKRGFLQSIYLPAYGFGAIIVLLISYLDINLFYRGLLFLFSLTLLEFISGIFFLNRHIRVWEYDWGYNYKEIVSVYSSLWWLVLALIFYYFIFPEFKTITEILFRYGAIKLFVLLVYLTMIVDSITKFRKLFS